jgi:hypothetical protein
VSVVVSVGSPVGTSNLSTAAKVCFGARWEYRTVMAMVLCPLLDRANVHSGHDEAARECVSQAVPRKPAQPSGFHGRSKPESWLYGPATDKVRGTRPFF